MNSVATQSDALSMWIDGAGEPIVIGILNLTPDSFSDGGTYASVEGAVTAATGMIEQGASIIDVGGESTRPGATPVSADEQIRRTCPVIALLARRKLERKFTISIDTTQAAVASAALDAGAHIINDTSAGLDDENVLPLAATRGCGLILMHRLRPPREDEYSTRYVQQPQYAGGVYTVVRDFLRRRIAAALEAGVRREAIVIDPGLGFGKSVAQNYELAARLGDLQRDLGMPAMSAASRKSFLARPPGCVYEGSAMAGPRERLAGSLAMTVAHWRQGIRQFRVHDVREHVQALQVLRALEGDDAGPAQPQFRAEPPSSKN